MKRNGCRDPAILCVYSCFIAIFSTKAYSELFFILPVSWRWIFLILLYCLCEYNWTTSINISFVWVGTYIILTKYCGYFPSKWIRPKLGSFDRRLFKWEARRFLGKSARSQFCESPLKIPRHLVQLLAIRILIANSVYTQLCQPSFIYYTQLLATALWTNFEYVPNGAMNIMLFFSVSKDPMSAPRYWQLREDVCTLYKLRDDTSANKPSFF